VSSDEVLDEVIKHPGNVKSRALVAGTAPTRFQGLNFSAGERLLTGMRVVPRPARRPRAGPRSRS